MPLRCARRRCCPGGCSGRQRTRSVRGVAAQARPGRGQEAASFSSQSGAAARRVGRRLGSTVAESRATATEQGANALRPALAGIQEPSRGSGGSPHVPQGRAYSRRVLPGSASSAVSTGLPERPSSSDCPTLVANPSLEATRNGSQSWPRGGHFVHHPPRGQACLPLRSPQLKRWAA